MISDTERREVARRLREHSGVRLFTGEDVERLIGIELSGFRPKDADNSYNHLADLIEPSEPEGTCGNCKHFIKDRFMPCAAAHGYTEAGVSACEDFSPLTCDRDALLALADEFDAGAKTALAHEWSDPALVIMGHALAEEYAANAHRIREALGVES